MSKFFFTLLLFAAFPDPATAQDLGYLRITKDVQINGKNFYKDEIYAITAEGSGPKRYSFIIGEQEYNISSSAEEMKDPPEDRSSLRSGLIKSMDNNMVHVDVSQLSNDKDTIYFTPNQGERVPIFSKKEVNLKLAANADSFRLYRKNMLVISYTLGELAKMPPAVIPPSDKKSGTVDDQAPPKDVKEGSNGWLYVLIILGLAAISLGAFLFLKKQKSSKKKVYAQYDGTPLESFASSHLITLDKLIAWNSQVIPKNYAKLNKHDKKEVHLELRQKGTTLLVPDKRAEASSPQQSSANFGSSTTTSRNFDDEWDTGTEKSVQNPAGKQFDNSVEKPGYSKQNSERTDDITVQIKQTEGRILDAIRQISSRSDASNETIRLNQELSLLKNEMNTLITERRNLDLNLRQLQAEKIDAQTRVQELGNTHNEIATELNSLKEKINSAEYLKGYAESVASFLQQSEQILLDAYSYFDKLSQQYPQQSFPVSALLVRFQDIVNPLPVGNWWQIVQDIRENGVIVSKKLIRSLSQIKSDQERQKEFQRMLFSEMLSKYSSAVLILAEAFRNIDRFHVPPAAGTDVRQVFGAHITALINKLKAVNLEVKYVQLFRNFEDYLSEVQSIDKTRSLAYREIGNLEKGSIAEIVSYGMRSGFEDTKTTIILA